MERTHCIVCGEIKYDGKIVVENPSVQHITSLLNHAQNLVEGGNLRYQSLANLRSELFDEEISALRYHRVCRQGVLKLKRSAAASSDDYMTPAKRGRPAKAAEQPRKSFRSPEAAKPKEAKCVFVPHFCEWEGRDDLHRVESLSRGYELMVIKKETTNDSVRAALAELDDDPAKAAALEFHYHRNCLVYAHRTCKSQLKDSGASMKDLCNTQILIFLQSCLNNDPFWTDMSTMNNKYLEICQDNGVPCVFEKQQKYLKTLVLKSFPDVSFIARPDRRKSEILQHKDGLGEAVDFYAKHHSVENSESMQILFVAKLIRQELLQYKDKWKYCGDLTSEYHKPPLLSFLLQYILFGKDATSSKRIGVINDTMNDLSQILIQNMVTDRQVKHDPKKINNSFRNKSELPVTIGLPLLCIPTH